MTARILAALRRFEDSFWGDVAGLVAQIGLLMLGFYAPLFFGGAP